MASRRSRRKARRRSLDTSKLNRRQRRVRGKRADRSGGRIPVRAAAVSGIAGSVIRGGLAFARTRTARRLATIARQKISRLPGIGRLAGRTRRARSAGLVSARTGREIAVRPTRSVARRVTTTAAKVAAGGVAFEAGSTVFSALTGGNDVARSRGSRGTSRRQRGQAIPFTPGGIVPTDSITHTWVANGVPFAQLADGRVMVRRKNGTIKTFRRPRPIVLGRNPGIRDLVRADKKIDGLLKLVRKRMPAARRRAPETRSATQIVRAG